MSSIIFLEAIPAREHEFRTRRRFGSSQSISFKLKTIKVDLVTTHNTHNIIYRSSKMNGHQSPVTGDNNWRPSEM
jgi:hypothetical protein